MSTENLYQSRLQSGQFVLQNQPIGSLQNQPIGSLQNQPIGSLQNQVSSLYNAQMPREPGVALCLIEARSHLRDLGLLLNEIRLKLKGPEPGGNIDCPTPPQGIINDARDISQTAALLCGDARSIIALLD